MCELARIGILPIGSRRIGVLSLAFKISIKAAIGIEPMNSGFADRCLTTWLCRHYVVFPLLHSTLNRVNDRVYVSDVSFSGRAASQHPLPRANKMSSKRF